MGFLDKAKALANTATEKAVNGVNSAKKFYDEKKSEMDAKAYERENEGLTAEEIILKDKAKQYITFSSMKLSAYAKLVDGSEHWGLLALVGKEGSRLDIMSNQTYSFVYDDEPGLRVKFAYHSDKNAKYVHLTLSGLNRVGDIVNTDKFTMTGPFENNKKYKFGFGAAFDNQVVNLSLKSIIIEYFDGDVITLEGNWLNALI